jgi:hypothetical protein
VVVGGDIQSVLMCARPQAASGAEAQRTPQVYSLGDDEDEEPGLGGEAGAWAAELGLLALQAGVLLAPQVLWVPAPARRALL